MKRDNSEAIYLYCIARSDLLQLIEGTGVDGKNPLFLQKFSDIVAVISMVPLEEFCGTSAESRMKDLSWVGPRVCCHEEVVEQAMRHSSVLPARFGTIFSSLESLDKLLNINQGAISRFLDQVADKEEWAVKVMLNRAKAKENLFSISHARAAEYLAALSPGMRYFQEQRIRSEVEKELMGWLREICRRISNYLCLYASDFCERRTLPRSDTESDMEMVLNWAFLVPRSAVPDFHARISRENEDFAHQGLLFQLSGPWPPYSFCPSLKNEESG